MYLFQELVARQRVISNRTKRKEYLNKIIAKHKVIKHLELELHAFYLLSLRKEHLGDRWVRYACHRETSGTSILTGVGKKKFTKF